MDTSTILTGTENHGQDASNQDASNQDASNQDASNQDASNQDASNQDASNQDASNQDAFDIEKIKLDDGFTLADEDRTEMIQLAKDANISQENMQRVFDAGSRLVKRALEDVKESQMKSKIAMAEESKKDAEIGGDKLSNHVANAKVALDKFGTKEFMDLLSLENTGLGNNAEVIRFLSKIGAAVKGDDGMLHRGAASQAGGRKFYYNSDHN